MKIDSNTVGFQRCPVYERDKIKEMIEQLFRSISFTVRPGSRVLLKPNLISATRSDGLACTHPEVIAGAAEWFVDHNAKVIIGDSPAFGTVGGVMKVCGIDRALQGLPVKTVPFSRVRRVRLASGITLGLAAAALDCDILVNLPKVKAHCQLFATLAVKNYFGAVVGLRKPWCHIRYGDRDNRFAELLVDLLAVLPAGPTLVDGITAMQGRGPVSGEPYSLGLLAASMNPVALETALLSVLGLEFSRSPVWQVCRHRSLSGADPAELFFPLLGPDDCRVNGFKAPARLDPVLFNPYRIMVGGIKRLIAG